MRIKLKGQHRRQSQIFLENIMGYDYDDVYLIKVRTIQEIKKKWTYFPSWKCTDHDAYNKRLSDHTAALRGIQCITGRNISHIVKMEELQNSISSAHRSAFKPRSPIMLKEKGRDVPSQNIDSHVLLHCLNCSRVLYFFSKGKGSR